MKPRSYSSRTSSFRGSLSGFPLIEVHVVMAIIAILAAMLLPAFGKAGVNALNTQWVSNLKLILLGITLFAPVGWFTSIQ